MSAAQFMGMGAAMGGSEATASALAGGTAQALGAFYQAGQSRKAQRRAWKYTRLAMQNKYQWAVHDLEKAGLNPILAVGGGVSGGAPQGPGMSPVANPGAGAGATARDVYRARKEKQILNNEAERSYHAAFSEQMKGADLNEAALVKRETRRMLQFQQLGQQLNNRLLAAEVPSAEALRDLYQTQGGKRLRQAEAIIRSIPFVGPGAARALRRKR